MTDVQLTNVSAGTNSWIRRFCASTQRRVHSSPSTLEAYRLDICAVARWAADRGQEVIGLSARDLERYVTERLAEGRKPATLARHISTCRRFYALVVSEGGRDDNPATNVRVPQQRCRAPGTSVVAASLPRLLQSRSTAALPPGAAFRRLRDYAIVCVLADSGLRIAEVRGLRWDQVDVTMRVVRRTNADGRHTLVAIGRRAIGALVALRASPPTMANRDPESPYCFMTSAGRVMTRQAFCHVVQKFARDAGVPDPVTPSSLSRTGRFIGAPGPRRLPIVSRTRPMAIDVAFAGIVP